MLWVVEAVEAGRVRRAVVETVKRHCVLFRTPLEGH